MSMDAYPIEVEFPDISAHAQGNTGVAYVHTFDSGVAGPHVMINALTHGNEVCGAIVVDALLKSGLRPRKGKLTLSFANVDAYARFDPRLPDKARFVDQDFNRVWTAAKLDDVTTRSSELDRARAMRPVIDTVDLLLDLHSMHEKSKPLIVAGPLAKGADLAERLGTPATVIQDEGHPEGRRMRDYEGFGNDASDKNALLIECGQHWEASAVAVARDCTARFLLCAGIVAAGDLPSDWLAPLAAEMCIVRVTDPVVAQSMDFRFAGPYTGLETFSQAGTVIGWSDGQPVRTPYDDCMLVMPSLRQLRPGVTVVRLGRIERRVDHFKTTGTRRMKVQQVRQAVQLNALEDWGTAGLPGAEPSRVSGLQYMIPGHEAVDTGVFECSPGAYRRSVKQAEVMHFIKGCGTFTPDGEDTIRFEAGDTLFFEANTEGLWKIDETLRKIYVIF